MRILTVKQPWAWAIIHAGKNVENRPRNLAGQYTGDVAIHAGAAWDTMWRPETSPQIEDALLDNWPLGTEEAAWSTRSAIIGVVHLDAVHGARHEAEATPCSDWADDFRFHLQLSNPRALPTPIPYRGALGLRTLPDPITKQIYLALAEVAH